jgi:hypothetical protein
MSSVPRILACRFSSVRSGSRPANSSRSDAVNSSKIGSIEISRKSLRRLSASRRASECVSSEVKRDGIETQCTLPGPRASAASAAVTAESIPPDTPTTTSVKPFFCT